MSKVVGFRGRRGGRMCIRLTASQDGPLTARWTLQSPRIVLRLRSDPRGRRSSCAASSEEGASRPPYPSSVTERRHRVYRRRGSGPSPGLHRALCRVLRSPPAHRCAVAHRSLASAETYSRTLALIGVTTTRSSPLGSPPGSLRCAVHSRSATRRSLCFGEETPASSLVPPPWILTTSAACSARHTLRRARARSS